jgi:Ca2+-binding RTX toxin-like protein
MATFTAGAAGVNFDDLQVGDLLLGTVVTATPTSFVLLDGPWREEFTGQFTYSNNEISGGTVTGWRELLNGQTVFNVQGFSVPATTFVTWAATNNNETARQTVFGGSDSITGSNLADRMYGYAGNDTLTGGGGQDYLRGNEGDDSLSGGDAFDDLHGNVGNDTVDGGLGSDWVVGGQGNDMLTGGADTFDNVVYGNLGADTCIGGDGIDWARGGQGDDSISGGGGADLIWGDRGDDTISGGAGADVFSIFGEAGLERILDFNVGEGDRLRIEAGYTYSTSQVGADVVVTLSGGAQAVLVNANLSSLGSSWIFTG